MYVVDSSARKATITLTGEEVAVKFPCTYSVFGIKGDSMLLYPKSGMAQGDDGVYDTAEGDGSVIMCLHYQADTVYIKGTGSCVIWAGNSTLDNPFNSTGKGGGGSGGDNTHYKGTTTTAISNGSTTNPIVIDGEEYTAVFGDIVVYGYTEFVFDGTTWSEFGRPFDTTPTSGSANAVTSDGIYKYVYNNSSNWKHGTGYQSAIIGESNPRATGRDSVCAGRYSLASANYSVAFGNVTLASNLGMFSCGRANNVREGDLFVIGNGTLASSTTSAETRSNIFEVNDTSVNVNGSLQMNGVNLPVPYTTMPTITAAMLGQIAQYVGTTDANYTQGYFYVAASDGAAEPTYSWVNLPTSPRAYSETVLYTASSPHTNNIELSQVYTNFDDIVVVWTYSESSGGEYHNRFQQAFKTSALVADDTILVGEVTSGGYYTAYAVVDTTHINFIEKAGTYYNWISKVIGIKY